MRIQDRHILPKFRDGWSYLYVDHCRIDREAQAVAIHDAKGKAPVPCATLCLLMLGPGTSISHAAVSTLADSGCLIFWCGEEGVRLYAYGEGKTRYAHNLLHQARLWADPDLRLQVVTKMYAVRFDDPLDESLTLRQIRGKEGVRVRDAYARASRETGVPWSGRSYDRGDWASADPVNRALSTANSCLYGICHAGILALGLSPALGFIHTGKMLSFVYDVADLFKTRVSIPVAFRAVSEGAENLETRVRKACRDAFKEQHLLKEVVVQTQAVLDLRGRGRGGDRFDFDSDPSLPGVLWDPTGEEAPGGTNFAFESLTEGGDGGADP